VTQQFVVAPILTGTSAFLTPTARSSAVSKSYRSEFARDSQQSWWQQRGQQLHAGRPQKGAVATAMKPPGAQEDFMWNTNENRPPFGFATNAEVWNGRVSMVSFVYLFIQEAIFGPILKPHEGLGGIANTVFTLVFVLGLGAVTAAIWTNQENDQFADVNLDNVEEYM
jgi:hypothetical protein